MDVPTGRDPNRDNFHDAMMLLLGTIGVVLALVGGCTVVGLLIKRVTQ